MPVYNEARTLRTIVGRVLASPVGRKAAGQSGHLLLADVDDDNGKSPIGPLSGEGLQRQAQVLGPAKAWNADDDPDGLVKRGRNRGDRPARQRLPCRHLFHYPFQRRTSRASHPGTVHSPATRHPQS